MKNTIITFYRLFAKLFFDPFVVLQNWRALPDYVRNYFKYSILNSKNSKFKISASDLYFNTADKFMKAGLSYGHYFLQDLWAATKVFDNKVIYHVDVASRIDGFVAHLLPFCKVDYVDIRDIDSNLKNLTYVKGDICNLPYGDNSIDSLSCLHVLEHIGLGRYGDDIDPEGYIKGAKELSRILKPGGNLYFSTPVGNEKLCFDAHRVFSPITIIETFNCLELISFSLIDDKGESIIENADYELAHSQNYGCGLFVFKKTILNL